MNEREGVDLFSMPKSYYICTTKKNETICTLCCYFLTLINFIYAKIFANTITKSKEKK